METDVAEILLRKDAVTLRPENPFKYASGILSPIYCDNRILMSYVKERTKIVDFFLEAIRKNDLDVDVIAGTEAAGIPWAAWIAARLNKPMVFVRKKQKDHGKENRIEGHLHKSTNVVVIEDLVSTGGSSLAAVEAVREAGGDVIACVAIFDYGMAASKKAFEAAKCRLISLSNFQTLVDVAVKKGYIKSDEKKLVLDWSKAPEKWGK
ncbi:orotate phosphoribosyltransferase [Candidatus Woesearchaeota archaeon]|nr:orotate phosphoribosyltransferase [Candidatus Woesearchaeota archaeon]